MEDDDKLFRAEDIQQLKDEEKEPSKPNWAAGGFLIVLGIIFLLRQIGLPFLENWWLLFLLIPIYWIVAGVWESYAEAGRQMTPALWRKLFWSLFPFVFIILGFAIGWNVAWPLILIALGVGAILFSRSD